jgi:hypothetical protein
MPVDGKCLVQFTLFNNSTAPHEIELSFMVPDEFAVPDEPKSLVLDAKEERNVSFALENFSALENSSYAVFLAAGYRENGQYHGSFGSTSVHIKNAKSPLFVLSPKWVIVAMVALFLIFLALQFRTRGRQKR